MGALYGFHTGTSRRNLLRACWAELSPAAPAPRANPVWRSRATRPRLPIPPSAALLDRAVQAVYNRDSPLEAWKAIARPDEVVGLKVNCLSGRGGSTSIRLVEAVCERLQQAGIPPRKWSSGTA